MISDFKYALRMLAKTPGFTIIAVVTLALAIGANTAIFSLINDLFLRGLPFVDDKRIGIFGWSYGGYMTLMCLMRAPDAFAAGVAGAGGGLDRPGQGTGGQAP
jgi:putative ABC transport system permease protein